MRLPLDRIAIAIFLLACLGFAGWHWLRDHPQHNPWAPLTLRDPIGWATAHKVAKLRGNVSICREFLERSGIAFDVLPTTGTDACRRTDRLVLPPGELSGISLAPARAQATCPVHAGVALWLHHSADPAAQQYLGSSIARIEHLGTHACRRIGGGSTGRWSEHATGNALDIAAFVLEDGTRVSVLSDWGGEADKAAFLHEVRDKACDFFGTVLSPDYNQAHADHLHLDQASRNAGWSFCR